MPVVVEAGTPVPPAILSALPPRTTVLGGVDELPAHLERHPHEYAVVLGPTVPLDDAARFSESIRLTRPGISVVLLCSEVLASTLTAAMDAGIRDVVETRSPEKLTAAVERAQRVWEAIHGTDTTAGGGIGRVVTVFSPKGGVGKTTTAVNLALALADGGRRTVCLVDLDLAFGDIAITLQLFPHHTIYEAVPVEDHLDYDMLETLLTRHGDGVMVLAAPTQPDAKDRIRASLVGRVLRTLKENFDYVVVDTAPSFEEQVLQAFDETDDCVLVATLDVPTLKNVKIAMETLDLLQVAPDRRWLVLNRADAQAGLSVDKVESVLGMPVTVPLPTAIEVASATNSGRPIVLSHPQHAVSRGMHTLADRITGVADQKQDGDDPKPETKSRGLFARQRR